MIRIDIVDKVKWRDVNDYVNNVEVERIWDVIDYVNDVEVVRR